MTEAPLRPGRGCAAARRIAACLSLLGLACGASYLDPESAGSDFVVQGEYAASGSIPAAQVVALGGGEFDLVMLSPSLPGVGPTAPARTVRRGRRAGELVRWSDGEFEAVYRDGRIRGGNDRSLHFSLARIERRSPTLGAAPPPGATRLFGGGINAFDGNVDARGFLEAGATSRESFGDARIHLEFRTPFMPDSRGQARGNSGVYLQGRYEIQVLDSFGLEGAWNECGGIYKIAAPLVNMALPPLAWQTYDIEFRAARFDADGQRREPARVRVEHNGVLIHDDVALPGPTGRGDAETPSPGPLVLQDHWNPVVYRNIWVLEHGNKADARPSAESTSKAG